MKTHDELRAIIEAQKSPRVIVSEKTVEETTAIPTRFSILEVIKKYTTGRLVWVQKRGGTHAPAWAQQVSYNVSAYKSSAKDQIGELTPGTGIDLQGFFIEVDGEGRPIWDEIPNPAHDVDSDAPEFLEVPKLITKGENEEPLELQKLMTFRPQWGTDFSKPVWRRPKGTRVLNLVPGDGVPRKGRTDTAPPVEGQEPRESTGFEQIDWNKIANLETEMKAPILNAKTEEDTAMNEFIEYIPDQENFGKKAEDKGYRAPSERTTKVATSVPSDPFAGAPEAK